MSYTVAIKPVKRNDKVTIYLVLKEKGHVAEYVKSLTKLAPGQWDAKNKKITKHSNARKLNLLLEQEKGKLNQILIDCELSGRSLSAIQIKEQFLGTKNADSFIDYALEKIKAQRGILAEKTIDGYFESIGKLKLWKPDFSFDDLTYENLTKLESWLANYSARSKSDQVERRKGKKRRRSVPGHTQNARYQVFACLRKINNMALAEGRTNLYPFRIFKFKSEEVPKEFLEEKEVDALFELWPTLDSIRLKRTLAFFLFSCETGVSADDHRRKNFHWTDKKIYFHRGKTNTPISILLSDRAKMLVDFIQNENLKQSKSRVNLDLRDVMAIAGIKKELTFHTARNTFAVMALENDVPMPVVQKILGHRSIKTTEIYAKIANRWVDAEMRKFNERRKKGKKEAMGAKLKA